jgi:hypothetical protein
MAPAVAAVSWLGSAIGSISIGSGAVGAIVTGAVKGAIVGAIVGGATAAITGGDIGDGILKGAAGGALTGGIVGGVGYAMNGATQAVQSAESIDAVYQAGETQVGAASEMITTPPQTGAMEAMPVGVEGPPVPMGADVAGPTVPMEPGQVSTGVGGAGAVQQAPPSAGQQVISPGQTTMADILASQEATRLQLAKQASKDMWTQGALNLGAGYFDNVAAEERMQAEIAAQADKGKFAGGDYRAGFTGAGARIPMGARGALRRPQPARTDTRINVSRPTALARNLQTRRG